MLRNCSSTSSSRICSLLLLSGLSHLLDSSLNLQQTALGPAASWYLNCLKHPGRAAMASRSVEIQLTNGTRDVTLRSPRTYCFSGYSSVPPSPIIPPGATGCCAFANSPHLFKGSVGLLVYEAEAFTLAILFSNPYNYSFYYMEFALEISPEKAHLGLLEDVYQRMYRGLPANPQNSGMLQIVRLHATQETMVVSAGGTKVMATMSSAAKSIVKVVVENKDSPPPYSEAIPPLRFLSYDPRKGRRFQKKEGMNGPCFL